MTDATAPRDSKRHYLERQGTLAVVRPRGGADSAAPPETLPPEQLDLFLLLTSDGEVIAFNGHVDLGTGIRTALAQIVAEELDVAVDRVTMVLGDTGAAPNQGPTIASETIQVAAVPLRQAAAQARHFLVSLALETLEVPADELRIEDGVIVAENHPNIRVAFGSLLEDKRFRLSLTPSAPLKAIADYRIVGHAVKRVDIPAKATGTWTYVHDFRLPGMLHGRVVRPPYAGVDSGDFVGNSLLSVDESSVDGMPGIVAIVVIRDFVGIVAEREEQAAAAADRLRIAWKPGPRLPDLGDIATALKTNPGRPRVLLDRGAVDRAIAEGPVRMQRTYLWPYQMHASIGPSCAVADWRPDRLTVWSGTQNPHPLRADLARLFALSEDAVEIVRLEAAGCYGRNCADDVSADAALLSRAVGRPVRVQLTREQEHLWEPKGAAQIMEVDGGLRADGSPAGYDFATRYPSNFAPTLALLLTGTIPPVAEVSRMGDRTAIPPYAYDAMRVTVHDMAPIVRAAWLRGVSALPNTFAHESYIDELAAAAGIDPVEYRLRLLDDPRAAALVRSVAERAAWEPRTGPRKRGARDGVQQGQGFAYARYVHGEFPGTAAAWAAWAADVEVDVRTGLVQVTRVVVGQDSGLVINPAGVQHQIHGNVIQSLSRTLKEEVSFDRQAVTSREWGSYPILTFPELPVIQVVIVPRPEEPPLGVGESTSVPSAAAIANAIFDATGIRLREPPFTPERVRAALRAADAPGRPSTGPRPTWRRWWAPLAAGAGAVMTLVLGHREIPPTAGQTVGLYSSETIERGRQLAALGNCAVCHTAEHGIEYAGGRGIETPFGVIYATNITPDVETGIGSWSFDAFDRSMRQGIHRDGRQLYPAFPYTAFTRTSASDMQALYAYLMSRPPVSARPPGTRLPFPFNFRPLLAAWNALYLREGEHRTDPSRSAQWNRGAYLVEGLGHCGACHTPRNVLGAEREASHLSGGVSEGWEAPPLTAASHAPVPWTEGEFYAYLRTGFSPLHGVAAGPMAPVVAELKSLPDDDIRAMAAYLASYGPAADPAAAAAKARSLEEQAQLDPVVGHERGARIFEGACAACHEPGASPLFGVRPSLALNTNLRSARPDNLIRAVLDGVSAPGLGELGAMPPFRSSLDDRQMVDLLAYLRARFANDMPAWKNPTEAVSHIRAELVTH